jgi:indole-3-glycerol phosphate synthase
MTGLLAQMAVTSRERVEAERARIGLRELRARCADLPAPPRLRLDPAFDLIAEVKLSTPSEGVLVAPEDRQGFVVGQARRYEAAGAVAVSVLTEPLRFGGELGDLRAAAAALSVPAMRKDFLVDPYQVWEAREAGAGGVLLIVRMLDERALEALTGAAIEAGLFVLIEAFDATDLERCGRIAEGWQGPELLVGVNVRDLVSLQVDEGRLEALASLLPPGAPAVAESGMRGPADTARAACLGYRLGLVGTALMRSTEPEVLGRAMLASARGLRT